MSEENKKGRRIKQITVRFNREVLPFQHIRIEAMATITKDDDADEVGDEVVKYVDKMSRRVERVIYDKQLQKQRKAELEQIEKEQDNIPY